MWPTYFIPRLRAAGIEVVFAVCGEYGTAAFPGSSVTLDFSTAGLRDDDIIFWVMTAHSSVNNAVCCTDVTDAANFRCIWNGSGNNFYVFDATGDTLSPNTFRANYCSLYYTRWSSGDPDSYEFSRSGANGAFRVCGYVMRNVHVDDPFPWLSYDGARDRSGAVRGPFAPMVHVIPYLAGAARLDFVIDGGNSFDSLASSFTVPSGDGFIYSAIQSRPDRPNTSVNYSAGFALRTVSADEAVQLLTLTDLTTNPAGDGWTFNNCSWGTDTAANNVISGKITSSATGLLVRDMTKDVTVPANTVYALDVWVAAGSGITSTVGYYVGATYYGISVYNTGITERHNDVKALYARAANTPGFQTTMLQRRLVYIGPFEDDTDVTLAIGIGSNTTAGLRTWNLASGTVTLYVENIGLYQVDGLDRIPPIVETVSGTTYGENLTQATVFQNFDLALSTGTDATTKAWSISLLVRAAESPALPVVLHNNATPKRAAWVGATETGLIGADIDAWSRSGNPKTYGSSFYVPRPAWPIEGGGKYYAEITCENLLSSSGSSDIPAVFCYPMETAPAIGGSDTDNPPDSWPEVTFSQGVFGWSKRGRFYEDTASTLVGGGTTWLAGDVLGIGLNLVDGEIDWYKNGTLVRTTTIGKAFHLKMPWFLHVGLGKPLATADRSAMSVNLTGPFASSKPTGFAAWDWVNEVS